MAIKSGLIIFAALQLGCLALPAPDTDFDQFFEHVYPDAQGRIVGGQAAPAGAHPHMVSMTSGSLFTNLVCGGSIITQRTILTAAHCIAAVYSRGSLNNNLRVRVGSNRWDQGTAYRLSSNVTHQHYVSSIIKNDIGILYTETNIVFSNLVRPIVIEFEYAGANIESRAAGWGRTRAGGSISAQLLELDVLTITGEDCINGVAALNRVAVVEPHIELCTMHPRGTGHGMCNGDSGSALVRRDRGTQIGIVSWGIPCARGAPDMFVRVSAYRTWFEQHIRN